MISKRLHIILFIAMVLIQLYLPGGMILEREDVLQSGRQFKFKTAPIDPADPFRGRYVALNFINNIYEDKLKRQWFPNEEVFAEIKEDGNGFAYISYLSKTKPPEYANYIKVKILYVNEHKGLSNVNILYPFDRYYMEENKAMDAEQQYLESLRDTSKVTFALVRIKEGTSVLEDVIINDSSLKDLVKN